MNMNGQTVLTDELKEKNVGLNSVDALVLFYQVAISTVIITGDLPVDLKMGAHL